MVLRVLALFIREAHKVKLLPITHGGDQEMWVRPGTLPLHQIIGFGIAAKLAMTRMREDLILMEDLSNLFLKKLEIYQIFSLMAQIRADTQESSILELLE